MGNLCSQGNNGFPDDDDYGLTASDYADILAQERVSAAKPQMRMMERAWPSPTDHATRLTCWLSSWLADGFANELDRLYWRILYHVHWQQDIEPVHAQWLDAHLPPVLTQCVLAYEAIPNKDASRGFVRAGEILLALSPLNEKEKALLRTLHARELTRMQPHVEALLNNATQFDLHVVDLYSILEQLCEQLEPFQLKDDLDANRLVWQHIQRRLCHVAILLRAQKQALSPSQREEWNACHQVCFSHLASRFPTLLPTEQVVIKELLTA
jgi:hypothetical protein